MLLMQRPGQVRLRAKAKAIITFSKLDVNKGYLNVSFDLSIFDEVIKILQNVINLRLRDAF